MATPPKKKESPAEPFKRVLGLATRAIAGDDEMQVSFAPGKPELDGRHVQLPEPSRIPSPKEIAVIRGWADSFALTAARHDQKLHNRLAPSAGPARQVFEAAERARVESLGAMRMQGMASNLTAKVEDQYAHGRFSTVTDRAEAPIEDALARQLPGRGVDHRALDPRPADVDAQNFHAVPYICRFRPVRPLRRLPNERPGTEPRRRTPKPHRAPPGGSPHPPSSPPKRPVAPNGANPREWYTESLCYR